LNFENLLRELERRRTESGDPGAARPEPARTTDLPSEFPVRYSPGDGLRGWLQAKAKRSAFYGAGVVQVKQGEMLLQGWQRTWLGVPVQAERVVALESVRHIARVGNCVHLRAGRPWQLGGRFELEMESAEQAKALIERLPESRTTAPARRWSELRQFNEKLR